MRASVRGVPHIRVTSANIQRITIDTRPKSPHAELDLDAGGGSPLPGGPGGSNSAEERDPAFLRRLVARDRDTLGRFYELFFERIYAYVRRLLVDDNSAEDVTQEVFMHIQRSLHTYDPERALGPWVFTIATNKVRDHWRSRAHSSKQRETSLDDDETELAIVAPSHGPLPKLEAAELRGVLARAIEALPESLRATLILRTFEGLEFSEIGRLMDRNETAVRKRYSRALEELRRVLDKQVGPGGVA